MTKEKYHLFVHHFNHSQIVSLQNPLFESSSSETLEDTIAGTYRTPTQKVMGDILAKSTNDLLDKLPNLKATVIRFRLGFNGRPLKLNEIGSRIDLTKERVRQIEKTTLQKLKHSRAWKELEAYRSQ
jgi:RNA polymerase primary sigma factor